MRLRRATLQDCAGLAHVQVDSYRIAYAGIWSPELLDPLSYEEQEHDWQDWMLSSPEDLLFVAESDSAEVVGYALVRPGPAELAPYDSELVALHVHPSHYRQGIGRSLLATAAGQLREQGCVSMMLWTMEGNLASGFYEHLGAELLHARKEDDHGAIEIAYGWFTIDSLVEGTG